MNKIQLFKEFGLKFGPYIGTCMYRCGYIFTYTSMLPAVYIHTQQQDIIQCRMDVQVSKTHPWVWIYQRAKDKKKKSK
ncbi:hypothetical protein GDO81_018247 [Engystomops pustulosus]|uniref:Uncharacterized protein n=1 Tax=Engystomops pustulosus TaxID=76066 RepID=A0AAV7ADY1_ENGPU|nr:hypothetical protein GDO81_018247 [Engystomops pustulosus]